MRSDSRARLCAVCSGLACLLDKLETRDGALGQQKEDNLANTSLVGHRELLELKAVEHQQKLELDSAQENRVQKAHDRMMELSKADGILKKDNLIG